MLVYIKPKSTFPELHSDTLFGAIIYSINELFPSIIEQTVEEFLNNNPPFLVSSSFPFLSIDNNKKRFYPMIMLNDKIDDDKIDISVFKEFKKVRYIEEDIFLEILKGKLTINNILKNFNNYFRLDNLLMKEKIYIEPYSSKIIVPNNCINRLNNFTDIFYSEGLKYIEDNGVFCFIEIINEDYKSIIESSIRFLKDRGFGNDISTGKGQFDYEIDYINFSDLYNPKFNTNKFMTLSRFIPNDNDLNYIDDNCNYEISFKRGISREGNVKRQIRFFNEGSTFSDYEKYYGKVVTSSKNSVEYGFAFPLRFNGG